jgi:hypothetical protein
MNRSLAVCAVFYLSVVVLTGQDLQQLIAKAKNRDPVAVLALGASNSPRALEALQALRDGPERSLYNNALRVAKAKAGFAGPLLNLAAEALLGGSAESLQASQQLPYLGGIVANRILMLLLNDFTGGTAGGGDLIYLSNAQNVLIILPQVHPLLTKSMGIPGPEDPHTARQLWSDYFSTNPGDWTLSEGQLSPLIAEAIAGRRFNDVATLAALGGRSAYGAIRVSSVGNRPGEKDSAVLRECLEIAYGDRGSTRETITRLGALDQIARNKVLKILAFLKLAPGLSLICQFQGSVSGIGKSVHATRNYTRDLLKGTHFGASRAAKGPPPAHLCAPSILQGCVLTQ